MRDANLSAWIGAGRVDIRRDYPEPGSTLRDVEVIRASDGRALLDEPKDGGRTRGRGWISTVTVTSVEPA